MTQINESQFHMWRTLFAISHADDIVTEEEIRFMTEALEDVPFSPEQQDILKDDITNPKDIVEMFKKVTEPRDQAEFFKFARELVWVDGDYGKEEQEIMLTLKRLHIQDINVDDLIGNNSLSLEDEEPQFFDPDANESKVNNKKSILYSFREKFLKERIKDQVFN